MALIRFAKEIISLIYTKNIKIKDKKIISEKPVSLAPLNFKEALAALLKIKTKPKEEKDKEKKRRIDQQLGWHYVTPKI